MARGKIEQEIALKVTGAQDVKAAEQLVEDLDGKTATATIAVDDKASTEVRSVTDLVAGLDDEKATIVLRAQADQAEREIKKLTAQIGRAKDVDTIRVKVDLLGNAERRLGELRDELERVDRMTVEPEVNVTGLDRAKQQFGELSGLVSKGGATAAGLAGLATGAFKLATNLADASLEAEVLSNLTGDSIENASRLQAVWATTGADVNDLADVLLQMNGVLAQSPDLAEQLGINLNDGATIGERFVQMVGLVQAGLVDANTQSQIFGEEGVRQVARLTTQYEDLGAAMGEVKPGRVFTEAERAKLDRFSDTLRDVEADAAGVATVMAERVLPVIQGLLDLVAKTEAAVQRLDEEIPEGAREAGISLGDIFSGPQDIINDFRHNLTVVTGQVGEITGHFDAAAVAATNASNAAVEGTDDQVTADQRLIDSKIRANAFALEAADAEAERVRRILELADEQRRAADEAAAAAEAQLVAVTETQRVVNGIADVFSTMGRRTEALSSVLELGNTGLETLGQIHDVSDAIRDLGEFIRAEGVPNIFDPNDVDAGPFLDRIAAMRGPIQQAVVDSFASAGPEAALRTAQAYVDQIYTALNGALSKDQIEQLLGLTDLEARVHVAVDQASLLAAKASLEALVGLQGQSPYTASIGLLLDAGEITPQAAQYLINQQLKGEGVVIPSELDTPPTAAVLTEVNRVLSRYPTLMPTQVGYPRNARQVHDDTQAALNRAPLRQPVVLIPAKGNYDQGGTVGGLGGVAGERGPEILDDRYLTSGPTYVPPGTRVTSTKRTRQILTSGRPMRLRGYANGGTVQPAVVQPVINISAAVIGNRFDVMRAVRRANLDQQRLLGLRV